MSPHNKYIEAIGRNPGEQLQHSHLYYVDENHEYFPMCKFAWNRGGTGFSIFRGHRGERGLCKICDKNRSLGLKGVPGKERETKWL